MHVLQVIRQGGARHSAGMHQGVPWYRLTDALQEELRKTLVDALRLMRLRINPKSKKTERGRDGSGNGHDHVNGDEDGYDDEEEEEERGEHDVIRGLEPSDIQFIKDKLVRAADRLMRRGCKPDDDDDALDYDT